MKTNNERFNQIKLLEEFQQRCICLNEQPYIDDIFGYKIKVKGKKHKKYDVILTDIKYEKLESKDILVIPDIFNKIQSGFELKISVKVIDFGNIESLPYNLCYHNHILQKVIGKRVYNIGYKCFYKCTQLSTIDFPLLNAVKMRSFEETSLTEFIQPKVDFVNYSAFVNTKTIKKFVVNKLIDNSAYKECSGIRLTNVVSITINHLDVPNGLWLIRSGYNFLTLKEIIINNFYFSSLYNIEFYLINDERHIRIKHLKYVFKQNLDKCDYLTLEDKKLLYKYSLSEVILISKSYDNNVSLDLQETFDIALLVANIKEVLEDRYNIKIKMPKGIFKVLEKRYIYIQPRFNKRIKHLKSIGFSDSDIKEYINLEYKYFMGKER